MTPEGDRQQRAASDATGAPAITVPNVWRVPAVVTANKGTIADTDGLPAETAFTWQWVRVDGGTETNIAGATNKTYTLTADDVGKTIKVKASFTDNATNSEGPLKSAAGSAVTAAATCTAPVSYPGAAQIWTGTVKVGQITVGGQRGVLRGFASETHMLTGVTIPASGIAGALDSTTLTVGTNSYTIRSVLVSASPYVLGQLFLGTTSALSAADRAQLTLYVCDQGFPLRLHTSTSGNAGKTLQWTGTGLDWTGHAERTLYISRDQTAPTVASAEVTGTALTITFTEDMGGADLFYTLANSAFTVKKRPPVGMEQTVMLSGAPVVSGKTVTLTLGAAPLFTDSVTVSYSKPTMGSRNKLADKFSNEVANFTQTATISNNAPTGAPAITVPNVWRVPAVVTANKGTIADTDGLPAETAFTWQWVRVDGANETNITGATGKTYTLTADDVGKTIKVKASFTDNAGKSEGPFKSAAGSAVTAAATCNAPVSYSGGATEFWTGKVKVGQITVGGQRGVLRGFVSESLLLTNVTIPASGIAGELSNTTLDTGTSYTIKAVGVTASPWSAGSLYLATSPAMSEADRAEFTLYVCDEAFPLHIRAAATGAAGKTLEWVSTGLDWTDHAERTFYISRDEVAPTVESVEVTETTMLFTYTEELAPAPLLANSAFTVDKRPPGGTEQPIPLIGAPVISGNTVMLMMAEAPAATDSVKVSYTKPTTGHDNKKADKFDNEVADFTRTATVNNANAPTSELFNVGGLGAYWSDTDADGNLLEVTSCTGSEGFRVIWTGPEDNRRADQWEAQITTRGGAGSVTHFFRESPGNPGYFELKGTVNLTGPGSISVRVRGRFGEIWGTWSPRAGLYCIED